MSTRRILLVDDEACITSIMSAKLERAGDQVDVAADGAEALSFATAQTPDLVVTDLQMPGMDGFELACSLKTNPTTSDVPVILLTARSHLLQPSQLGQTNIQRLLSKPFSARELMAVIEELLPREAAA